MPDQREAIVQDAADALQHLEQATAQLAEALAAVRTCPHEALNQAFSDARAALRPVVQGLVRAVVLREMQQYANLDADEGELRSLRNRQPLIEQTRLQSLREAIAR